MKKFIMIATIFAVSNALADNYVNGYVRRDGTYVAPHYRSESNNQRFDNYSSQGNFNPYTGQQGSQRNEFTPGYIPPIPSSGYNGTVTDYGNE